MNQYASSKLKLLKFEYTEPTIPRSELKYVNVKYIKYCLIKKTITDQRPETCFRSKDILTKSFGIYSQLYGLLGGTYLYNGQLLVN